MLLYRQLFLILSLCLPCISGVQASELISEQCEPLSERPISDTDVRHSQGLLWQISKAGKKTSYLFGTIHVSDVEVTTLADVVSKALNGSSQFVMEALPDAEQMLLISNMMLFTDGRSLSQFVDADIFKKITEILSAYHLEPEAVSVMKPWAAFLLMNYPPEQGKPFLDLVLMSIAQQNGAEIAGLESMQEQVEIFNQLSLDEQLKLLTDTVCHYDAVVKQGFSVMKSLYLKRDLGSLYNYSQRFFNIEEPVYKKLLQRLLVDRNITMTERMQPMLEKGNSFIAVGALHLTGEDGILSLLEKQGYSVKSVY